MHTGMYNIEKYNRDRDLLIITTERLQSAVWQDIYSQSWKPLY